MWARTIRPLKRGGGCALRGCEEHVPAAHAGTVRAHELLSLILQTIKLC